MAADIDLRVWLDLHTTAAQTVMVPYVQSVRDLQLTYRMDVIQNNGNSSARISQKGKVSVVSARDTALTRIALSLQKDGECRVELMLNEEGKDVQTYHFDCASTN